MTARPQSDSQSYFCSWREEKEIGGGRQRGKGRGGGEREGERKVGIDRDGRQQWTLVVWLCLLSIHNHVNPLPQKFFSE